MAKFKLNQSGQQIQTDLNKVESLPNIKSIGSGLHLDHYSGELSTTSHISGGYTFTAEMLTSGEVYVECLGLYGNSYGFHSFVLNASISSPMSIVTITDASFVRIYFDTSINIDSLTSNALYDMNGTAATTSNLTSRKMYCLAKDASLSMSAD